MREIQFRGKDLKTGKWVYGYYVKHINATPYPISSDIEREKFINDHTEHHIFQDGFSDWGLPRNTVHYQVDPNTIGQYIGLKDKNSKEIYEGDIVDAWSGGSHAVLEVKWGNATAGFFLWKEKSALNWHLSGGHPNYRQETCEIIGNIHDNEELLENK